MMQISKRLSGALVILIAVNCGICASTGYAANALPPAQNAADVSSAPAVLTSPTAASLAPSLPLPPPVEAPKPRQENSVSPLEGDPLAWDGGKDKAAPPPVSDAAKPLETAVEPLAQPSGVPATAAPEADKTEASKTEAVQVSAENKDAATDKTDKIEALEKRLTALEETVGKLQQNTGTEKTLATKTAVAKDSREIQKKPRKSAHHKKVVPASSPAAGWVLKAAKPDMAWVAEKGSSELRTVTVGDSLPGVGKVTAVVKDLSGHWVVNGTKGRISQ